MYDLLNFYVSYYKWMKKLLQKLGSELWQFSKLDKSDENIRNQLQNLSDSISASEELLLAQKAERVIRKRLSWIRDELYLENLENKDPLWDEEAEISIDKNQAYNIAKQFYISHQEWWGWNSMLKVGHIWKDIAEALINIFREHGHEIEHIEFDEPHFNATLFEWATNEWFEAIKKYKLDKYLDAKRLINIRQNLPKSVTEVYSPEALEYLSEYMKSGSHLLWNGELFYTLTILPTLEDAIIDNMNYPEYKTLFLEACDQPWEEIKKAHNILIDKLDQASSIQIYNADGTNITMSIKDMTFANSLVLKNIPWSEIFSAPVKDSVNGRIIAKWRFQYEQSPIIENIRLEVKDWEIIDCGAEKNGEDFRKIIYTNSWANYFGEIWIGTNPHLQQHLVNGLLVEKVSGSFHMAIGAAYSYTHYNGKPVYLNNWNISDIHRDITTMLRWQNSHMKIDGDIIQQNWIRLDPALKVLNEGRWAVEKHLQPNRWQIKYTNGY